MRRRFAWVVVAAGLIGQAASAGRAPTRWEIDPSGSLVEIQVGKAGWLSIAGHAHRVLAPAVSGLVTFDPADPESAAVSLAFDAGALRVTGEGEPPDDVPKVQETMLGPEVLDVGRFPRISFDSSRVTVSPSDGGRASVVVEGHVTLHGTTRPLTVRAAVSIDAGGDIAASGSFALNQTDFGITPVTAAGGAIKVKDRVDVRFVLKASRSHDPAPAR